MRRFCLFALGLGATALRAAAPAPAAVSTGAAMVAVSTPAVSLSTGPVAPPPKTVITSKKVQVLQRGRAVEFTGDVTLTREGDRLTADRVVTEEGNTVARAWGHVALSRNSPVENLTWEAWGDEAAYDTSNSSGTLWGVTAPARAARAMILADGKKEVRFQLEAQRITFFQDRSGGVAESSAPLSMADAGGGVFIRSEESAPRPRRTELWSGRAVFDGREGRLTLENGFRPPPGFSNTMPPSESDRPFCRQTVGREIRDVSGEVMTYRPSTRRLVVERNAMARVLFEAKAAAVETKLKKEKKKARGPAR